MLLLCSFLTCTSYCVYVALQSHDDDFHSHETLIVQLYQSCDSPWITIVQIFLRDNYLIHYPVLPPTM